MALVDSFSTPADDPHGVAFDGIYYWTIDSSNVVVYQLDTSGSFISSFYAPGSDSVGLAYGGNHLWISDWGSELIYELDLSGNIISSFASPCSIEGDMTYDGIHIWIVDTDEETIFELDTSGNVISSFKSPASGTILGIAFDGTYLWLVSFFQEIYKLDTSGAVLAYTDEFDSVFYPSGFSYDGTYFCIVDNTENKIYRFQLKWLNLYSLL